MFLSWMPTGARQTRTKPKSGRRNTSRPTATGPIKWIRHSKIGKLNGHGARGRGLGRCPDPAPCDQVGALTVLVPDRPCACNLITSLGYAELGMAASADKDALNDVLASPEQA